MGIFGSRNNQDTSEDVSVSLQALRKQTTSSRGAVGLETRKKNEHAAKKKRIDGRSLRATGRTQQMNIKAKPDIKELVYDLAASEGVAMSEIVEKAVLLYAKK